MHDLRSTAPSRKKNASDGAPASTPAVQQYQAALLLLQQGRFERALAAFEKLLPEAPVELLERTKMYIATCRRQMLDNVLDFQTPEERYDYAISQLNQGYYEEAREQFLTILAAYPNADYAFYGMALLDSIMGHAQDCLANLTQAIEINPKTRLQARADNDFQNMVDDPRFTELLYPENL